MEATRTRFTGTTLAWKGLSLLLGFFFIGSGMSKVLRADGQVVNFERWNYPDWFLPLTGAIEVGAGVILLASLFVSRIASVGALLLACVMCGALYTRIGNGEAVTTIIPPAILLVLALTLAWGRRGEFATRA